MALASASFLFLIPLVLSAPPHQNSICPTEDDQFDYIVVGSGPGVGPLAVNLAEAGWSNSPLIPAFIGEVQFDPVQSWEFYVKDYGNKTQAARNNKLVWKKPAGGYWVGQNPPEGSTQLGVWYPRAGTLGGCDTYNGGITVRPSDWDWDDVRNLFLPPSTPGHGFSGYQPVGCGGKSLFEKEPQILAVAQGSAAAFGFTKDERRRRYSSGSRVNEGVAKGLPLAVRYDSLVSKVLNDDALRATGADPRFTENDTGIRRTATAKRKFIVAVGAFNTPRILLLSGIGPADELEKRNIFVSVDLHGVGRNLQDHYEVPMIQEYPNNFTFWDDCDALEGQVNLCYEKREKDGTGPYSTLGFYNFVLNTSSVTPRKGERDLILYGAADGILGHLPPYTDFTTRIIGATNVYTYTVSESQSRNRACAVTDGGDKDVQGLIDGIEFARKIFKSIPGLNGLTKKVYPGEDVETQEQLRQYVRDQAYGHHASSTAALGSGEDPLAILDCNFRVRGVKGLRVVDASAFPLISIFMASEQASEVILKDAASMAKELPEYRGATRETTV
ncbi:putative GMC oxidoreductase [Daldinia bambusicola]|nr:putative GMC oxidoreductase [Daldinia bambusicola]